MATKIIIFVFSAMEIFFFVWDFKVGRTHIRFKTIARLSISAIIAVLLLIGVLNGPARYLGIILLLTVMGIISIISFCQKGEREVNAVGLVFVRPVVVCFIRLQCLQP